MGIDGTINPTNPVFWQNLAAEHIYNSADRRTASVEALKAVIVWAFGIFSVGGFALTLFGQLKDFDQNALIFFGIAFFLLTLAYYVASRAQFPAVEKFKLGDPKTIADAYSETVRMQGVIFRLAAAITGLGFFFLALGLLLEFGTVKKNNQPPVVVASKDPFIKTGVEKRGDTAYIPITISWEKSKPVFVSYIKLVSKKGTTALQEVPLSSQVLYTDSSGVLSYSQLIAKKDSAQNILVRVLITEKTLKDTTTEKIFSIKLLLGQ